MKRFLSLFLQALRGAPYDYTSGSIRAAVFLLSVPMILELSLESVFAVVDMFFVSKLGQNAMATVGLTESVITLVYSAGIGLSTAATAIVARRTGERQPCSLTCRSPGLAGGRRGHAYHECARILLSRGYFTYDGAAEEVIKEGAVFTRIMLGGSAVIMFLFLINGVFRGAGDAAMAMRSLWLYRSLVPVLFFTGSLWS